MNRLASWLSGTVAFKGYRTFRARLLVQGGFALTCVLLGWQFAAFVRAAQAGAVPLPHRPPGVEGFLPISGLMGLLDAAHAGSLNRVHPAAAVIVALFLVIALVFRKATCSWLCPVGLLSDALARLGRRLFGRNYRPWGWLDFVLRGLKYFLLVFFLQAILAMPAVSLHSFLYGPYNRVADVKMFLFFADPSRTALVVLGVLAVISVFVAGAWCRYLCPYGALLGLFSWLTPVKVRRDPEACSNCRLCDRACPARLLISQSRAVTSPECTGCLDCVASCTTKKALRVGTPRRRLGVLAFAGLIVLTFVIGWATARAAGVWDNDVTDAEYVGRVTELDDPSYRHH